MAKNGWVRYRWTDSEEKKVIKAMEKTCPDNYREAAKILARTMVRRTPEAIITRYYNTILKRKKQDNENDITN